MADFDPLYGHITDADGTVFQVLKTVPLGVESERGEPIFVTEWDQDATVAAYEAAQAAKAAPAPAKTK